MTRLSLRVEGVVQGVGFRPFVFRQARALGLVGWVKNGRGGVEIQVEGPGIEIERFVHSLVSDLPSPGLVERLWRREIPPLGDEAGFHILPSDEGARPAALLPPDLAVCSECLAETLAPEGRRHGYPFTCCARCGPRYSLVEALPYDRARTTMRAFVPCDDCRREYDDPEDRRFHAEPIACPRCGPHLSLLAPAGNPMAHAARALDEAAAALRAGRIVALRGLGGFQLLVDATSEAAVTELRRRKHRDEKPFAVLFRDLTAIQACARVSPAEASALMGPEAPIVLLRAEGAPMLASAVAPGNPLVGAMLPATPLHRLLVDAAGLPLVCTSGNLSGEPLCVDVPEALERLAGIADLFLVHDRPIARPLDDSVLREGPAGIGLLRRARGYAPRPVARIRDERPILGLGAHQKSTVTLAAGGELIASQHLGDLDGPRAIDLLERTARDLVRFFDVRPAAVACDLHPDFPSTRLAERLSAEWGAPLVPVQHHHAHVVAVMAEHGIEEDTLGLAWDGMGLGLDGTLWGGEALFANARHFLRFAHLRPFRLPGGERAAREPWRSAIGLLFATLDMRPALDAARNLVDEPTARALMPALARGINAPQTTSVGRLFDAVAALIGLRHTCSFEGQAAMELEWCAATYPDPRPAPYPMPLLDGMPLVADTTPLVEGLLFDRARGRPAPEMAARFHASLAALAAALVRRAGARRVALAGGCFQNALLARLITERLAREGCAVLLPARVPPNDGAISIGQVCIASARDLGQET